MALTTLNIWGGLNSANGKSVLRTNVFSMHPRACTCMGPLLAALVYYLIREGKRVFYIPGCGVLHLEPTKTMKAAFNLAFYDSVDLGTIGDHHDINALIRFMSGHQDLFIIVDQLNTLEVTADDSLGDMRPGH